MKLERNFKTKMDTAITYSTISSKEDTNIDCSLTKFQKKKYK